MAHGPPTSLRVLFVEDSTDDVELIRLELARHGFQVQPRVAETRTEFLTAIKEGSWDVVLSDHSMKGFSSTDALAPAPRPRRRHPLHHRLRHDRRRLGRGSHARRRPRLRAQAQPAAARPGGRAGAARSGKPAHAAQHAGRACRRPNSACGTPSAWRRSAASPAASRTTSTTC